MGPSSGPASQASRAKRAAVRTATTPIMRSAAGDPEAQYELAKVRLDDHIVRAPFAGRVTTRLVELGVEPFLLSSVLRGVVAQRLIRRICEHCAVEGTLNPDQVTSQILLDQLARLGVDRHDLARAAPAPCHHRFSPTRNPRWVHQRAECVHDHPRVPPSRIGPKRLGSGAPGEPPTDETRTQGSGSHQTTPKEATSPSHRDRLQGP